MSLDIRDLLSENLKEVIKMIKSEIKEMDKVTKKELYKMLDDFECSHELDDSIDLQIDEMQEKIDDLEADLENQKSELADIKQLAIEINNYGTIDQCKRFVEQFANTELVDETDAACSSGCANILDGNTNFEF